MRLALKLKNGIHTTAARLRAAYRQNDSFCPECAQVNLERVLSFAGIALPLSLLVVLVFLFQLPAGETEARWRVGIMACHSVLLFLMPLYALAAKRLQKAEKLNLSAALILIVVATILVIGTVITATDQFITPSITPFIVTNVVVGTVFLLRPSWSAAMFLMNFVLFSVLIGWTANPNVLLSNQVNALTASAVGFGLSSIMWRHFVVETLQMHKIEEQRAELTRVNRALERMAFTDSLTGLPNRRYFDQEVARAQGAVARGGNPASIVEFDLDLFKEINDQFGHDTGDEVLRQVASFVSLAIRKADMFARYGGEEFILLLPDTTLSGAAIAAEKLRAGIEAHPFSVRGGVMHITASFGVAQLGGDSAVSCYRTVDRALYRAKQGGRNSVEVMRPEDVQEPDVSG